jgi:hypothetical protein
MADPAMVIGMGIGLSAFNISRALIQPILLRSTLSVFSRIPFATRAVAASVATLPEVGALWGSSKLMQEISRPGTVHLDGATQEMLSLGMTLTLLKSMGFVFGGIGGLVRAHAVNGLPHSPVFWNQSGMLAGIMASHGVEMGLGWRPPSDPSGFFTDSLITLVHFNGGGMLSHAAMPGLYRFNAMLQRQMAVQERAQLQNLQRPPLGGEEGELAWEAHRGGVPRSLGLAKIPSWILQMSSRDKTGGDSPRPSEKIFWRPAHRKYSTKGRKGRQVKFHGEEWRGVVEQLENIEKLLSERHEALKSDENHPFWRHRWRQPLDKLLASRTRSTPQSFSFDLTVLSQLFERHNIFVYEVVESSRCYQLLNDFTGIPLLDPRTFDPFISSLTQQFVNIPAEKGSEFLQRRHSFNTRYSSILNKIFKASISKDAKNEGYDRLRELLYDPSPSPPMAALEHLEEIVRSEIQSEIELGKVRAKVSRPVIWNPFLLSNDKLILHPSLGEGEIVGEGPDGRLQVLFQEQSHPITVMESVVVRPGERDKYENVLTQRLERFRHLPFNYLPLVIVPHLSNTEASALKEIINISDDIGLDGKPLANFRGPLLKYSLRRQMSCAADKADKRIDEEVRKFSSNLAAKLGIDPLAFIFRLMVGEYPSQFIPREAKKRNVDQVALDRILTPDLVRGFLQRRPWMEEWEQAGVFENGPVRSLGFYYPDYYPNQERPQDQTERYFAFREGDPEAFRETTELFRRPIEEWARQENRKDTILVPMIGTAPMAELAQQFALPVLTPWLPRPQNYGAGVEGKRANVKMQMVEAALALDPGLLEGIEGRSVLLLDDNMTDAVTYIQGRKLLLNAGAMEVGLMVLTKTIRSPEELAWEAPPMGR